MLESVEKTAYDILNKANITKLPVDINTVIKSLDYKVFSYEKAAPLIEQLNLSHLCNQKLGFSAKFNGKVYIFVSDDLTTENERIVISHELGHIQRQFESEGKVIGCSDDPNIGQLQEDEADDFMRALLAPLPLLYKLDVADPKEIQKLTGLTHNDAKLVFSKLRKYKKEKDEIADLENASAKFNNFVRRYIFFRDKRQFIKHYATTAAMAIVIIALLIITIFQNGKAGNIYTTAPGPYDPIHLLSSEVPSSDNVTSASESQTEVLPSEDSQDASEPLATTSDTYIRSEDNTNNVSVYTAPSSTPIRNTNLPIDATYYWTDSGTVFHCYADCQSLKNVIEVNSGSLAAAEKEKNRLCKFCEGRMREDG